MKAERLAEEGEVDQAMLLQNQAEMYSRQHEELRKRLTIPEKTMLVCDICGVFINSTDNDQRRRVSGQGCTCMPCVACSDVMKQNAAQTHTEVGQED